MKLQDFKTYDEYSAAYAELVQQCQDKTISLVGFIERQDDLYEQYLEYMKENGLEKNEDSASMFLDYADSL